MAVDLGQELLPVARPLIDRHLSTVKEWYPHTFVPWSRAHDYGETWDPETKLPEPVRAALLVNLLTEDNLPYYYRTISANFGRDDAWGQWSRRWTAEEARHSIVIREFLHVTQAIDPWQLEDFRMQQMSDGVVPEPETVMDTLAYVAAQELATRISHRNTGVLLNDESGKSVMKRVAMDENLHHLFYRDLVTAGLTIDPDQTVAAIMRQITNFEMPGTGIAGFSHMTRQIADAGIYNTTIHWESIVEPLVFSQWKVDALPSMGREGEEAREKLLSYCAKLGRVSDKLKERTAAASTAQ
jgi:acyl-[acyl-carrier-protein] desaturase